MKIKWRVWSGFLSLLILVSVVISGVMRADSANYGLPNGTPSRNQVVWGRYLITAVAGCADCHSPNKTPNDPEWLSGYRQGTPGQPFEVGLLKVYPSNITPDNETGIGKWTPRQVFNALHHGEDDDGNILCPPMPWPIYRNMSDRATWAVVAYLKSIKPVKNEVPEPTGSGVPVGTHPDCSPLYRGLKPLPPYPGNNEILVPKTAT